MPHGKKFSRFKRQPEKKKGKKKFNYRESTYVKERDAKNEEIERRRKFLEEQKSRQKVYDESSEEEQENPLQKLLKTFGEKNNIENLSVLSNSDSDVEDDSNDDSLSDEHEAENEDSLSDENEIEDDDAVDDEKEIEYSSASEGDEIEEENVSVTNTDEGENESINNDMELKYDSEDSNDNENIKINLKDNDEEDEETNQEDAGHVKDPFSIHLINDLDNDLYQALSNKSSNLETNRLTWPVLGNIISQIPQVKSDNEPVNKKSKRTILEDKIFAKHGTIPSLIKKANYSELYIKSMIRNNIIRANSDNITGETFYNSSPLTPLQKELFSIINNYQDLLYTNRTFSNESEIRYIYCLHTINHVLKTRTKVLHHNAKIKKLKLNDVTDIPDEYRDQGLVRPKVLILVPFRHSCLKVVEKLISIFIGEDKGGSVINKKRFLEDFGSNEIIMPKKKPKPADYELMFKGNIDDAFKIGISITKKAMKLYSDFYSSDIIISSILGLRMLVGAEGESERDYDFLASIEVLIMDQIDVFYMQNWDHLLHILDHMHLQPKQAHGTDFARVRSWCINGWSKYYRQTLLFSSINLPEINNIFNKKCFNYAGKFKDNNPITHGSISHVMVQIPQVFHKFLANNFAESPDARFNFFITQILPQYKDSIMNHTLIFIPSYFDFVRVRNYFINEELNFVQICEYTKDKKIARARDMFFHSDAHFLLYTERLHFFRRIRVKGIRHIIFYDLPAFPHFYSEMCNLMHESYQNPKSGSPSNMTVTAIYCKYNIMQLSAIVDSKRASKMISSEKNMHMLMTGE